MATGISFVPADSKDHEDEYGAIKSVNIIKTCTSGDPSEYFGNWNMRT